MGPEFFLFSSLTTELRNFPWGLLRADLFFFCSLALIHHNKRSKSLSLRRGRKQTLRLFLPWVFPPQISLFVSMLWAEDHFGPFLFGGFLVKRSRPVSTFLPVSGHRFTTPFFFFSFLGFRYTPIRSSQCFAILFSPAYFSDSRKVCFPSSYRPLAHGHMRAQDDSLPLSKGFPEAESRDALFARRSCCF